MENNKKCTPPPGYMLRKASNTWQKTLNTLLKPHDLTHVQFILLAITFHHSLGICDHELNQKTIAQEAQIEPMTTSSVLRRLENKGLILRETSQSDKRSQSIKITQSGKSLFNKIKDDVYALDQKFFGAVDDIDHLIDNIQKLYD